MTDELTSSPVNGKSLVDRVGDALEEAFPGQVERSVGLAIPTADGAVATSHNEPPPAPPPGTAELDLKDPEGRKSRNRPGGMNVGRLKSFVERAEKLEEEKRAIAGDIKDVYGEAKGAGYDTKTIRKIVAMRRMDAADRAEEEALLDVYKHALGMV